MPKKPYRYSKNNNRSKRVRNVLRAAPHRVVGQFSWVKSKRENVYWESRLERDAIRVLAVDPQVSDVHDQPCTVHYPFEGEQHEYTPDFRVTRLGKPSILEIKEFEEASRPENQVRFEEIARVLASEGLEFNVWTEKEFRRQPHLSNATYVLRFRNYPFEQCQADQVCFLLAGHPNLPTSNIRAHLGPHITTEFLFALVCHGLIHFDCDQPRGSDPIFHRVPAVD